MVVSDFVARGLRRTESTRTVVSDFGASGRSRRSEHFADDRVSDIDGKEQSQAMAKSYAADSAVDAVRKHPELVGAVAATAAIEKRGQADGLTPEQQRILQARVRQNVMNSIEAGNLPKPIEIREDVERHVEAENNREVSR